FTHDLDRANIRRLVEVRGRRLPDAKRWMITAAAGGGLFGLAGGTIADGLHGTNYHWLAGGFGGAIAGFFVSCVVLRRWMEWRQRRAGDARRWFMRIRAAMQILCR